MRRPKCSICQNKINSNIYIWDMKKRELVHKVCFDLKKEYKDAIVMVEAVRLRSNRKEVNNSG